jgi:hypothetical protein
VDAAYILEHDRAYGQAHGFALPPVLDHQGINDAYFEKASVVHYFYQRWLKLSGAD